MSRKVIVQRTWVVKGDIERLQDSWKQRGKSKFNKFNDLDEIDESQSFYPYTQNETTEIVRDVFKSGALNILSDQEYRVFQLVYRQGFSLNEAKKLMKVSKGSIQNYSKRLIEKLKSIILDEINYQYRGV